MGARRLALAGALVVAVVAAACGGDDGADAAATTTTVAPQTTTTVAPTTTTTAPATTTTAPVATGCDAGPRPDAAVAVTEAAGDFDGDGAPDTLVGYGEGTTDDPAPWHLRVELATGGAVDEVVTDAVGPGAGRALGGAEISASAGLPPDGSGVEAFASIGSGASVALVAVFQLKDCVLTRLNGPDGGPSSFAIGGTVTHGSGLRCEGISGGQRLVDLAAESNDGTAFTTTETLLKVDGTALVQANPPIVGNLTSPADEDAIQGFYSLQCTGVASP
jgi:hypothetical protein